MGQQRNKAVEKRELTFMEFIKHLQCYCEGKAI